MMSASDTVLHETWCTRRDADAFTELMCRHSSMVFSVCVRVLGNKSAADEVAQECFVELMKASTPITPSVAGWLHTVATRRSVDRLRSDIRRNVRENRYAVQTAQSTEPTWDDVSGYVDQAVAELSEDLRAPIALRFLEGKSHNEIAQELDVSLATVKRRLDKGIDRIREDLADRGIVIGAAVLVAMLDAAPTFALPTAFVAEMGKLTLAGGWTVKTEAAGAATLKTAGAIGGIIAMKKVAIVAVVVVLAGLAFMQLSPSTDEEGVAEIARTEDDHDETESGVGTVLDSPNASETSLAIPVEQGGEDEETAEEALPPSGAAIEAPGGAWIRGYVTEADGSPIANAEILLGIDFDDEEVFRGLSGVDGRFKIGGLEETQYLIGARYRGYAPTYVRAVATGTAGESVQIVLSHGGSLEGHVTLAGAPLSTCRVKLFHLADNTTGQKDVWPDATGFYRADALAPGAYQLEIMMENPAARSNANPRIISAKVMIEEGQTTEANFDFSVLTSSVEGQITLNGVAPRDADITLALVNEGRDEERRRTVVGSDGYYRFEELGSGRAQLSVRAKSWEGRIFFTVARNIFVPELENVVVDIEMLSGALISGRVSGVPEDYEAGVIVLPGEVEVGEFSLERILDLYRTATVIIDPMGSDEFHATGLNAGTYTVLLMAIKQGTLDPFGETITGSYVVELGEGEEVFIEHSFE